ncbi:MAG: ABC transporter permease [Oscillospiraceae bacterium]
MKKYFKNRNFAVGAFLLGLLFVVLLVSFFYLPYPPNEMATAQKFELPSFAHLLGTDNFGRDILSRVMKGAQIAFFVGFSSVAIGFAAGLLLGALAGYLGGLVDEVVTRVTDAQMAFPGVILALIIITVFGASTLNTAIALGITLIPRFCRITRAGFLQVKQLDYVKAARSRGASPLRIMALHIFPNTTSQLLVTASLGFASAILAEAGLSYLGLGIQPPTPSWGMMLHEVQAYLLTNPWYAFIPGCMITVMVLGFNLLGDGLRDIMDARAG